MKRILFLFLFVSVFFSVEAQITTFQKTYGDTADNVGTDVRQTSDGGYILIGRTYYSYPSTSISDTSFLMKLNSNGIVTWTKKFPVSSVGNFTSVIQTQDSGYAMSSYGVGNPLITRTNSVGDTLWTYRRPDVYNLEGSSITETSDKGFIIVGNTPILTSICCYSLIIKVDSLGQYQWGAFSNYVGRMFEIKKTLNDKYIIGGATIVGGPPKLDATRINSNGTISWDQTYFGSGMSYYYTSSIDLVYDSGYIIGGQDISNWNLNVVKVDSVGNFLWRKNYYCKGGKVRSTSDSSFYSASNTTSIGGDIRLMKLNSIGDSLWSMNYGGSLDENLSNMHTTSDCGLIAIGTTQSYGAGNRDVYLIKTDCNGIAVSINSNSQIIKNPVSVYPNPSSGVFNFHITSNEFIGSIICIYNSSGVLISKVKLDKEDQLISLIEFSNGIYFYQIQSENSIIASGKLTKN